MIILGIDPGFARLGFAVLQHTSGNSKVLEAGTFETSPKASIEERLLAIRKKLLSLMRAFKPDILSIERLFFAGNQKTAISVAEARGVILLTAAERGLKVYEYTPPEVKLAVTGSGKADKKAVQKMILLQLSIREKNLRDDAYDAIALTLTAAYSKK